MAKLLQVINVGKQLKEYRKSKGYTQMDVASKIQPYGSNMSESTYAKIEQEHRNIFFEDFVILKIVLGFEYVMIFSEYEKMIMDRVKNEKFFN